MKSQRRGALPVAAKPYRLLDAVGHRIARDVLLGSDLGGAPLMIQIGPQRLPDLVHARVILGERAQVPPQLFDQLRWLRTQTKLPLCVGFGISKPEHVRLLKDAADGIIVGSAIVRQLEQIGPKSEKEVVGAIGQQVAALIDALK